MNDIQTPQLTIPRVTSSAFSEVYLMDCMLGMARYPDKYFDLAIVDPPYGISINHNMGRRKGDKPSDYKKVKWDDSIPDEEYFDELFRVSKNQIIWGGNYYGLPPNKCFVIWKKPQIGEKMSFAMCEYAWASFDSPAKQVELYGQEPDRFHPTQKPVALYKWLLKNYAKQGDKILDTHVGSASSLIACHDMGFDAVGFELDPDYYAKSKQRLEDFMRQPRIDAIVQQQLEQLML